MPTTPTKPQSNGVKLSNLIQTSAKTSGIFLSNNEEVHWHVVQISFPNARAAAAFQSAFTQFSEASKTTVKNVRRKERLEQKARKASTSP